MKREDQQDATIRCLLLTSVSRPLVTPNNTCTTLFTLNRHNAYIKTPAPDTPDRKTYEADTSQTPLHPFTHNIRKHTRSSQLSLLHKKYFTAIICVFPLVTERTNCSNRAFVLLKMGIMIPETC